MNYNSLKSDIAAVVRENGNQEITGENLQGVLTEMIDNSVGTGYLYKGIATPETQGGTPDQNVFYLAGAGTYGNFSGTIIPQGSFGVFKYNGVWSYEIIKTDENLYDFKFANISDRQGFVTGYVTTDGILANVGSSVTYGFRYIPVFSGKSYKMTGEYRGVESYAHIAFSENFPVTGGVCEVISGSQTAGVLFDVEYTPKKNGYLLIYDGYNYAFSFFELKETLKTDILENVDNNIKVSIDYSEKQTPIVVTEYISGYVSANSFCGNIGESVSYGFKYIPVVAGEKYRVSGVYNFLSNSYGGVVFSSTILSTGNVAIIIDTAVQDQTFDIVYEPDFDGYLFAFTENPSFFAYSPEQKLIQKNELFSNLPLKKIQLVNSLYQRIYVAKSTHRIVNPASANGSFVIPVVAGKTYFVRSTNKVFASYTVLAFSDNLTADYSTGVENLVTVSENTEVFSYEYTYKAVKNGYLLAWSVVSGYGSRNYVEAFEVDYIQSEIYDYYLPSSLKIQTFGDSITDNFWGDMSSWVNYIPDNIKTSLTIVNSAVGGASIGGNEAYNIPNQIINGYTRTDGSYASPLQADTDLVVIFAGTNDWASGQTITNTITNLASAFEYIYENSKAKIIFCTPLQRFNASDQEREQNEYGEPLNNNDITLREECEELIKICQVYSVPVLNLNATANINKLNIYDYAKDGLHPQRDGDYYISKLICKKIKEIIRG